MITASVDLFQLYLSACQEQSGGLGYTAGNEPYG